MEILGLGYLRLEAPEPAEWRDFGERILGMPDWTGDGAPDDGVLLRMDDRRYRIRIDRGDHHRLAAIGWEISGRFQFDDALAHLDTCGVPYERASKTRCKELGLIDMAAFHDPSGYRHEIYYGLKWGGGTFTPPAPHFGFDTGDLGDQGMGHVVLAVPEYGPELEEFLRKVLGFIWAGSGGNPILGFWRSKLNKRSHTIGFVQISGMMGLQHIGVYAKTVDDIGIAYEAVHSNNVPLQQTLGRHVQDPVISFYMVCPAGCAVEYIWETERFCQLTFEANVERVSLWGHKMVGTVSGTCVRPVADRPVPVRAAG